MRVWVGKYQHVLAYGYERQVYAFVYVRVWASTAGVPMQGTRYMSNAFVYVRVWASTAGVAMRVWVRTYPYARMSRALGFGV
jgi:hypothetical protein